ncbi:glycosyl hydrolase family 43 [Reichenbachiella sp. 5M10]|uniref:glycoside hydrolase family protein n=1 Tax=Reichenbachiella sp. 5M10 TaxID=1889772 RepID=UPI000C14CFD3|nr:glycoside hydrolase family protein [Reichenbachiella sp. 5M10]PIB34897.1 glycosyl hydrolase family 43 [Reichenbachiella sp. 5M10]
MNRLKTLLVILSLVNYLTVDAQEDSGLQLGIAPVDGGLQMEDYWVWGSSVVKGKDGQYHMYASRWPKFLPFHPGWMIRSEIVHAVSDTPEGPYRFSDVALGYRGVQYWDGRSCHNPKIVKHDGKYLLYYMGSTHPFEEVTPDNVADFDLQSKWCIAGRWRKRVGLAIADSPYGPWERLDEPILDVKPDSFYSFLTSNPSPLIKEDGSVVLLFKGRSYREDELTHTDQFIGVATAPTYDGEYTVVGDEPVFSSEQFGEVEDPHLWRDDQGFHMIAKDMTGDIIGTGHHHGGVLAHSEDGIHWVLDDNPLAYTRTVTWDNGQTIKQGQLERPFVFVEDGQPTHIFFATMDGPGGFGNGTKTWNMVIPVVNNKKDLKSNKQR